MTHPDEGAATEQDVLLATKLHVPTTRRGLVSRSRLDERLAEAQGGQLTLVCAPAGFGKTSLLAQWARRLQRPVAWLSLDAGDNDPARFWRYVATAVDGVGPGVARRVDALLRASPQPPLEGLVTVLVNAMVDRSDQAVLVLDDYHLIQSQPIHSSLTLLLERLPAPLRLVLASRADPPLPLARLRARGRLVELRAEDLRFTSEETAMLLREATGLELPAASLAALQERTEGWAAGLQLAGLSLRGRSEPAGFVETFSGSHRHVLDYLAEEVLEQQPEHLRAFLLETSVLEQLCGELCDAVTGRTDSQAVLEEIDRANLFLVPLDEVRRWWRYHHLFADLLRVRLERERLERLHELHRNAATWCERQGLVDDAVRHAVAAGDPDWAARLISRHAEELIQRGEGSTLERWLRVLPPELVRARPQLCLAQATAALIEGRRGLDEVEQLLDAAERSPDPGEPYQPSVGRAASLLANVPAGTALVRAQLAYLRRDAGATAAFGRQVLADSTEADRSLRAFADWHLAIADWLEGRLARPSWPWSAAWPATRRPATPDGSRGRGPTSVPSSRPEAASPPPSAASSTRWRSAGLGNEAWARRTSSATRANASTWWLPRSPGRRPGAPGAAAARAAARRGRGPGAHRQPHRGAGLTGTRLAGLRRRGRSPGHPGVGAAARLGRGVRARVRRPGRTHGRPRRQARQDEAGSGQRRRRPSRLPARAGDGVPAG